MHHPGGSAQAYIATAAPLGVPNESLRHDPVRLPQHAAPATDRAVQRGSLRAHLQTATRAVSHRRRGGAENLEGCRVGRAQRCDLALQSFALVYQSRTCWVGSMVPDLPWRAMQWRAQRRAVQPVDYFAPPAHSPPRSGSASVSPLRRAAQGLRCSHQLRRGHLVERGASNGSLAELTAQGQGRHEGSPEVPPHLRAGLGRRGASAGIPQSG